MNFEDQSDSFDGQEADGADPVATNETVLPAGNEVVTLPPGTSLEGLEVAGRDLVILLSDGSRIVVPDGAVFVPQIIVDGVAVPPLNIAQLLTGNEPEPAAGQSQSSGGNFADDEGAIQDAFDLGDLLPFTTFGFPEDTEEEIIPFSDEEPEVLIQTEDDPVGSQDAVASVDEAGLPERGDGEQGEPEGTDEPSDSETTTGTIVFNAPDGLEAVTINGQPITGAGQTVSTPNGTLTITSIDLDNGTIGYSYTLEDNLIGDGSDVFDVVVEDVDGDQATATLTVNIADDAPIAADDIGIVEPGSHAPITGDVLVNDVPGADGYATDGAVLEFGNESGTVEPGSSLQGEYGVLTLNPDGTYTYTRDVNTPGGVEDTFTYTIVDQDGSTSSATLVIEIGDAPDEITSVPRTGEGTVVEEGGLPARGDEPAGTGEIADNDAGNNSDPSETTGSTITFNSPDGLASVTINGLVIDPDELPHTLIEDANGTFVVTGFTYDPVTGDGTIDYEFTLADNTSGDDTSFDFEIIVTDLDGDVATDTLTINVVDDEPEAEDDSGSQAEEDAPITVDVFDNDTPGADDVALGTITVVEGSLTGAGTLVNNGDGTFTYTPVPGEEGEAGEEGEGGTVSFDYTITDGDGDVSTATVTIDLLPDSTPEIGIDELGAAGEETVDEAGLPARGTEPAGSDEASDSEFASGTIAIETGNDTVGSLVINGVDVTNGGTVSTDKGDLVVTLSGGEYSYTYTLTDNTLTDPDTDEFSLTVTDSDGDTASTTLTINIQDDVPEARDDFESQSEEDAPVTVDVFANDTPGADGVDLSTIEVVPGSLNGAGTLVNNGDGTFTYTPAPGEEGSEQGEEGLGPITFDYTITDGDGDVSTATVTIELLPDSTPEIGIDELGAAGEEIVDEAGLPARGTEPPGSDEASDSETASGTIVIETGNDSVGSLVINGVDVTNGGTITTSKGELVVTLSGGEYSYTYTLTDNTLTDPDSDDFALTITDSDGDTASTTLVIAITDDTPTAEDDANSIGAGEFGPVGGNVLGNDTEGADGATVTSFVGTGNPGAPGDTITGLYGTLTIAADGTYSYTRNPDTPGGVEDTFTYTITDGDGDTATANLVISIADAPTTLDLPTDGEAGTVVQEDGLAGPPAGSDAASDSEFTTGTFTFTAPDGPATVTIGGVAATSVGQTFTGAFGTLTIDAIAAGSITYTYELTTNTSGDSTSDDFVVRVTDNDGDFSEDTLEIAIVDDVPTAVADSDSVTEDGPLTADGNVLTGTGGTDANASDGVADVTGADGASVTGVAFGATDGTVGSPISGDYGQLTLNADGSYSYELNNQDDRVQGLDSTETLTEEFTYTITDGDGDTSATTLTITINGADDDVVIRGLSLEGPDVVVDEDDLPDGSSPDAGALTQSGTFTVLSPDGLTSLTVGGVEVFAGGVTYPVTIDDPTYGLLTITGVTPVTDSDGDVVSATIAYTYVLQDNSLLHTGADDFEFTDSFPIVATDTDGSTDTDSLDIVIIDDTPSANPDSDSVTEDGPLTADGNVLTGTGGSDANATDGVADVAGADSALVTAISFGTTGGTVGAALTGDYGTLTLNADGSYEYILDNNNPLVQGLDSQETLTEVFDYTITDGDGDTASTTLTITINGADDGVTINGLDLDPAEVTVDEDDLAAGSSPDAPALTQTGSFTITGPDGLALITAGGQTVWTDTGGFVAGQTVTTAIGTFEITGVTPTSTDANGDVTEATVTFSYTLDDNTLTHSNAGEDTILESFAISATDTDGSSDNASVDVLVIDDIPDVSLADANAPTLVTDDSDIGGRLGATDTDNFSGLFTTVFGADGPAAADAAVFSLTINGGDGTDSGLDDTLTGESILLRLNGDTIEGYLETSGDLAFTLELNPATGDITQTQLRAVVHDDPIDPDETEASGAAETLAANLISLTATVTDGDGDVDSESIDISGSFAFEDDGPGFNSIVVGIPLDEDDLVPDGNGDTAAGDDFGTSLRTFTYNVDFGADGANADEITASFIGADGTDPSTGPLTLTSGGDPVIFDWNPATNTLTGYTTDINDPVMTMVFDLGAGTMTLEYLKPLDHPSTDADGANDGPETGYEDNLELNFEVVITDGDGDTATFPLSLNIDDDMAIALADSESQLTENEAFTIDALDNDAFGADGVDTTDASKVFVSTQATQGTVTYDPGTGLFTYTPDAGAGSNGNTADFFEYTIIDGDGDASTARVDVTLQTDSEPRGGEVEATVDDDGLADNNPLSTTGDLDANQFDDPSDTSEASYTGTLSFDVGNDTPATISFAPIVNGSTAMVGQETVTYTVVGNLLTATVTGGARDGTDLFTVEITDTATGDYVVTLLDNVLHDAGNDENDAFASIDFTVADSEGDTAISNLGITFDDDAPTATDNSASVTEGGMTGGNALTDDDGSGVDAPGADDYALAGAINRIDSVNEGTNQTTVDGSGNLVLAGEFGTLTINVNTGVYSYDSDANSTNSDAQDVFTYTIVDGDGDEATATLTIDIDDVSADVSDNDALVNEAGLSIGSDPTSDSEIFDTGQITVTGGAGTLVYNLLSPSTGTYGTLVLNPTTGEYTYTLNSPFTDTVDENGPNVVNGAESFNYEVRDTLGNLLGTGSIDVSIIDDVPDVSATGVTAPTLATDDSDLGSIAGATDSGNFAGLFTSVFGADGPAATDATVYALSINGGDGTDSGLNDTLTGENILLRLNGDTIEGYLETSGDLAFTLALNPATGDITQTQLRAIEHDDPNDAAETVASGAAETIGANLIGLTATVTDGDGDTDSETIDISGSFAFEDDGPGFNSVVVGIPLDEDDLPTGNGDSAPGDDNGTSLRTFTYSVDFGADGPNADEITASFVSAEGTDPSIGPVTLTSGGDAVVFDWNAATNTLTAYTTDINDPVLTMVFDLGAGTMTLEFLKPLDHPSTDADGANDGPETGYEDNLELSFEVIIRDGDGDTITLPLTLNIDDDMPDAVVVDSTADMLVLDESPLPADGDGIQTVTADLADNFGNTINYGADGAGNVGYALLLSANGIGSGFYTLGANGAQGNEILLTLSGNTVTGSEGGNDYFTITIDPATGEITFTQLLNVWHADGNDADDVSTLTLDGAGEFFRVEQTVTDNDGDSDSATIELGDGVFKIEDDGPDAVVTNATADMLVLDESPLPADGDGIGSATADFADNFGATIDYGTDGAGSVGYALLLSANGVGSGLFALGAGGAQGAEILLTQSGNTITGSTGGTDYFTITVDPTTGEITFTQLENVWHSDANDPDDVETLTLDGAGEFLRIEQTVTDRDGDSDSATIELGDGVFKIEDDGPSVTLTGSNPDLQVSDADLATDASLSFAGAFDFDGGTDGTQSTDYALSVTDGTASGLFDTATGNEVFLFLESGVVVGREGGSTGQIVFTVTVASNGTVELDQLRAVDHSLSTLDGANATLLADNLVQLTATITDNDGDTASETLDIGSDLLFADDTPTAAVTETAFLDDDTQTGGNPGGSDDQDPDESNLTGTLVDPVEGFGNDGGTVAFATTGAPAGFQYVASGSDILIQQDQGSGFITVVTVTLDPNTGAYTVTQNANILHTDDGNNDENEQTFTLSATLTDGDGDTDTTSLTIVVDDDTPIAVDGNSAGTVDEDGLAGGIEGGTGDVPGTDTVATGSVTSFFSAGADAPLTYSLSTDTSGLGAFTSGGVAVTYAVSGNTLTASAGATPVFTLVLDPVSGDWTFTLLAPLDHAAGGDENDLFFDFGGLIVATDADGDEVTATAAIASVRINDDTPVAVNDTNALSEDTSSVGGNILTDPTADGFGADGAGSPAITAISGSGGAGTVGGSTTGTWGTLDLAADGTYTYNLNTALVQGLDDGETETDTFTYTIVDGDGDTSTATLTITINGANDAPVVGTATVATSDEGLTGGLPDTTGTPTDTTNSATASGNISITDVDDTSFTVTLSIPTETLSSGGETISWSLSPDGKTLTGSTVSAGAVLTVVIDDTGAFTVTQSAQIDHDDATSEDVTEFTVDVNVNDGTTTTSQIDAITVNLEDDSPEFTSPIADSIIDNDPGASNIVDDLNLAGGGDGLDSALTITADTSLLFVGGEAVITSQSGNVLTGFVDADGSGTFNAGDTAVFTLTADTGAGSSGEYEFDLLATVDNGTPGTPLDIDVTITATDSDDDPVDENFTITINDGPIANDDSAATEVLQEDINAAFVLDFSGSVNNSELNQQLNAVKDAAFELFESTTGTVDITLITFSGSAQLEGTFTDFATFAAAIDGLNNQLGGSRSFNGSTDFTDAINQTIADFTPDPNANNQVFFLSDGNPNQQTGPGGTSLTTATANAWQDFVDDNDINVTAIGVGGGINIARLQDIDVDGEGAPVLADEFEDLIATLISVVTPAIGGNILANDIPSSNGIDSIAVTIDGITYTFDGVNTITPSSGPPITGTVLTVTTSFGGEFSLDFTDGSYTYEPPLIAVPEVEVIEYTVTDSDGDTDSATLTIDIASVSADPNFAKNDEVITNRGSTVAIDEAWLLANDDPGTTIVGVGNASSGSVSRGGGTTTFIDTGSSSGSFTYTASDGSLTNNAFVTVNREQAGESTLDGTSSDDILIGRDGANDDIDGGDGADIMFGGTGSDDFNIDDGDSNAVVSGSGDNGTISGFDTIVDFNPSVDDIDFNGTAVVGSTTSGTNGTDSTLTINGQTVKSHAVSNGIITFDDQNSFASALTLSTESDVAAVVDYLQSNDIGSSNSVVAFVVGSDTYVYFQDNGSATPDQDNLVKLEGVTLTNVSSLIGSAIFPVVLDLDGDGAEFVGINAGVTYDYDGDGNAEATAWVGADDAILAFDANGDGTVTDASEFVFGGEGLTDLDAIAARYDSNGDGVLDASDSAYADFGIWQDANQNGVADAGEFTSLADAGIVSIALVSDEVDAEAAGGDVGIFGSSSFTFADGSTGVVADTAFATSASNDNEENRTNQRTAEVATVAALASSILMDTGFDFGMYDNAARHMIEDPLSVGISADIAAFDMSDIAFQSIDFGGNSSFDGSIDLALQDFVSILDGVDGVAEPAGIQTILQPQANMLEAIDWAGGIDASSALSSAPAFSGMNVTQAMEALLILDAPAPDAAVAVDPAGAVLADLAAENLLDQVIDRFSDQSQTSDYLMADANSAAEGLLDQMLEPGAKLADAIHAVDQQLDEAAAAAAQA